MEIVVVTIFILFAIFFIIGTFFYLQGPPYVPSSEESTEIMVRLAKKYKPKKILDMGSGKGVLVLALAQAGLKADGVELNPWIARYSRSLLRKYPASKIYISDMWRFDISSYDMVVLYIANPFMKRLQKKLQSELKKGSIVISNFATLPDLQPVEKNKHISVYRIP